MPVVEIKRGSRVVRVKCPTGARLSNVLRKALGWYLLPCGGRGICGLCKVRVIVDGLSEPSAMEAGHELPSGYRLACQSKVVGYTVVEVEGFEKKPVAYGVEPSKYDLDPLGEGYGLAFDVGSSKIAAALVDLETGRTVDYGYAVNPQVSWGADVVSRIASIIKDPASLAEMKKNTVRTLADLGKRLLHKNKLDKVRVVVAAGNSVALPITLGVNPSPLGYAPYDNPLDDYVWSSAREVGLPWEAEFIALPPLKSFVGSDALCVATSAALHGFTGNSLLVDIGVNTEVICYGEEVYATSAPAGPAIEGGYMSCGASALEGAVEYARYDPSTGRVNLGYSEGRKGLAGSAIVSLIASLVEGGVIDERGRIVKPHGEREGVRYFEIGDDLILTQLDVREFQKAKAAIGAACVKLCRLQGGAPRIVVLAGSMGTLIDQQDAVRIGLIPKARLILQYGNLALVGAKLFMVSQRAREVYEEVRTKAVYVGLLGDEEYERLWIENLDLKPLTL